jgi:hypothetical protein
MNMHTSRLTDHFERVVVLSLPAARARRERVRRHLAETGLGGGEVQFIPALPGTDVPPPRGWQGLPAWGCLRSHLTVLRYAQMDAVESILVLEDDVVFDAATAGRLGGWLQRVPPDWGQIYLGGQHLQPPCRTALSDVLKGRNVNRAHAYAVSGRLLPQVIRHLTRWRDYHERRLWHVDHQFGLAHERGLWAAYTPAWWFAGQEADTSQINGRALPRRWWHSGVSPLDVPFLHLDSGAVIAPEDQDTVAEQSWAAYSDHELADPLILLRRMEKMAAAALENGALPAWRDTRLSFDRVARLWPAGARPYTPGYASFTPPNAYT